MKRKLECGTGFGSPSDLRIDDSDISEGQVDGEPGTQQVNEFTRASKADDDTQRQGEPTTGWAARLIVGGYSERAVERKTGLSRRQIRKIVNQTENKQEDPFGTSLPLKSLSHSQARQMVHSLAVRPGGVKRSELSQILGALFGFRDDEKTGARTLAMTPSQYEYLRTKVLEIPSEGYAPLFVPEWVPRENPKNALNCLLELASNLMSFIDEEVAELCHRFPEIKPKYARRELIGLAVKEASPRPLSAVCDQNTEVVAALSSRIPPKELRVTKESPCVCPVLQAICL